MKKIIIKKNKSQDKLIKAINNIKGTGNRKKYSLKVSKYFIGTLLVFFIIGAIAAVSVFAYFAKDLPDPNKLIERTPVQSTKIYDRTGEHLLYEIAGEEKRTLINIQDLPDYVKNAAVAIEDANFYNHYGIDFKGIIRAIWSDIVSRKKSQGGSTITQQLVKNTILTSEKTYSRKIKEIILSLEIERKFSKNEILQMYLNEIPYGSNIYGIEAASRKFFNKSAKDLAVSEAAALAALPQATTYYSPYGSNTDKLEAKRKLIVRKMRDLEFISEEEYKSSADAKPQFASPREAIYAPHFVMYVKEKLAEEFGEMEVERGGLKVYTALDWDKQQKAEEAVKKGAAENEKKFKAKNAALTAIDPKTGQILAMVGSRDYFDINNDGNVNVAIRLRQPGSSFKPFAYIKAFEKGFTPETILFDLETDFNGYIPHNYDNKYIGPVTMRQALQMSKNVISVKTLYLAGIKDTINLASKLGISTLDNPSRFGLSLVLGGGEVKLIDIVSAYGVFANEGLKNPTTAILKIEDSKGNIIKEYKENPQQILGAQTARLITDVLSDNTARTPAFGARSKLYLPDRPAAAKTGTTNDSRDAWTIGYTPSLAAGVWAGNNDNSAMKGAGGSSAAAPIWYDFMEAALKDAPIENFTKPSLIKTDKPALNGIMEDPTIYKVDMYTGKLATNLTPPSQIIEKTLRRVHCILYYADKNNPRGPIPANPADDPQFNNWEGPVQKWALENGYIEEAPAGEDDIHTDFNKPKILIVEPSEGTIIPLNSSFDISAEAAAPLPIKEVNFFFDGQLIQSDPAEPYKIKFTLPESLKSGRYEIKAVVYDIADNSSENSINIQAGSIGTDIITNPDDNKNSVRNISISLIPPEIIEPPLNFIVIASSDIPIVPLFISKVELINYKTKEILGSSSLEDGIKSNVSQKYYQLQWFDLPDSGKYQIYAKATTAADKVFESNITEIEIP